MLAAFCLAFFRLNVDYRGILWSAPLSVLTVLAISWHQEWAQYATVALAGTILIGWIVYVHAGTGGTGSRLSADLAGTLWVALAGGLAVFLCWYQPSQGSYITVAWPWNVPIGFAVAFSLGYLLGRRRGESGT